MSSFTPQQIEEFLQEFFDVVGARQYVGARYVPIFGRAGEDTVEWDDGAPYEPLTVVMHQGVSYVSRRYVPKDIPITDTDYWVETYQFNAQVEQYRQEVLGFQDDLDEIRADFVPFPDPLILPKYGTLGQVLSTLADGSTKWEDPVVPSDEQAEEVITAWLDEHPEATTTVVDGSLTDAKISPTSGVMRTMANITTGDLNDYVTPNKTYLCIGQNMTNKPDGETSDGILMTFGSPVSGGGVAQVYLSSQLRQYLRLKWGSGAWTSWYRVYQTESEVSTVAVSAMTPTLTGGTYMRRNNANGGLTDLNDAASNLVYQLISTTGVANVPTTEPGLCFTMSGNQGAGQLQIYMTPSGGDSIYARTTWGGNWSTWKQLANRTYVDSQIQSAVAGLAIVADVMTAFTNITCCGDSLTYSQVYTGADTSRQAFRTYPQVLGTKTGATVEAYASPGYTPVNWWNAYASNIAAKTNQLAIVYLGTNAGLTDTLDTDAPSTAPISEWANTNTGCYAKIVKSYIDVGARVILVRCYATSGTGTADLATTNTVIGKIADRFGCVAVDNARLDNTEYHLYPDGSGSNGTHYNDLGYSAFAAQLIETINSLGSADKAKLIPVA